MKFHSWNGMRQPKRGKERGKKGIDNIKNIHSK